ncbi:MAG: hypothetical protein PHQ75_05760 [Thermoguttaceae bacterium]|nr:hypothetical protein [Thermoguttaceae bacterium]
MKTMVEEIWDIRKQIYESTRDMTEEQKSEYIKKGGEEVSNAIQEARKQYLQKQQNQQNEPVNV